MSWYMGRDRTPEVNQPAKKYDAYDGITSIITGASSGLGRELAIRFSGLGHVILSGRNEIELNKTRTLCREPHNTTLVYGDLRDTAVCSRLAGFANLYAISYLICCAGEYASGPIEGMSFLDAARILDSNLLSTVNLIREVYPYMRQKSKIVHINSVAGKAIDSKEPVYCASKHGMAAFLKALRFEARTKQIRIMDVFPGGIQTPMMDDNPKLMDINEIADTIFTTATLRSGTCQIEELHLGRTTVL